MCHHSAAIALYLNAPDAAGGIRIGLRLMPLYAPAAMF